MTEDKTEKKDNPDGINLVKQCKICSWSVSDHEVFQWVTDKALQGISYNKLEALFRSYLEEHRPDYTPLHKRSIWNHFEKHLTEDKAVKLTVQRHRVTQDKGEPLIYVGDIGQAKNEFDEYMELCELYLKFKATIDKIFETCGSLMNNTNTGGPTSVNVWSQNKINTYVSMVNSQKSILAEISKMRQGNKLIDIAARYIIEQFTTSIVEKLSGELTTLMNVMERQGADPNIIAVIEEIKTKRLAKILVDEAQVAMGKTKKEFRLPDTYQ